MRYFELYFMLIRDGFEIDQSVIMCSGVQSERIFGTYRLQLPHLTRLSYCCKIVAFVFSPVRVVLYTFYILSVPIP